jgi:hypothetical protein
MTAPKSEDAQEVYVFVGIKALARTMISLRQSHCETLHRQHLARRMKSRRLCPLQQGTVNSALNKVSPDGTE